MPVPGKNAATRDALFNPGVAILNCWEPVDMFPKCLKYSSHCDPFLSVVFLVNGVGLMEQERVGKENFSSTFMFFKILLCDHLE